LGSVVKMIEAVPQEWHATMSLGNLNSEPGIPVAGGIIAPWRRELAAVCCYFNPCHYQRRLHNYHLFRAGVVRTGIRLLTVELAFGADDWELKGVPDVLRRRADDVLWHKERLLNIGIAQLIREGFQKIAWLDADLAFHGDSWPVDLCGMLDRCAVCQGFAEAGRKDARDEPVYFAAGAVKRLYEESVLRGGLSGLAWGARADLLRREPLYDACIIGGGDHAICFGSLFSFRNDNTTIVLERAFENLAMTPLQREHFCRWATRFGDLVQGEVGFINATVESLYHGEKTKRRYTTRYEVLGDFNPFQDIALNDQQCWRWATDKPQLHESVRSYFFERREDD
jgi:hypothetical protein